MQKAFHNDLAGQGASESGVLAGSQKCASEECAGQANADHGTEELIGLGNFRDVLEAAVMERGSSQDENRGIDQHGEGESYCGVDDREAQRFPSLVRGQSKSTSLHDTGMK